MNKPLFPLVSRLPEKADEPPVVLPENATPLDFMTAVYRDPDQPISRRLSAAIAAAPFVHPKLAVAVTLDSEGFAKRLKEMMQRRGLSTVIDATSNYTQLKPE